MIGGKIYGIFPAFGCVFALFEDENQISSGAFGVRNSDIGAKSLKVGVRKSQFGVFYNELADNSGDFAAKSSDVGVKNSDFGVFCTEVGVKSRVSSVKSPEVGVYNGVDGAKNGKVVVKSRLDEVKNSSEDVKSRGFAVFLQRKLTGRTFVAAFVVVIFFRLEFESLTEQGHEIVEIRARAVLFGVAVNFESRHH